MHCYFYDGTTEGFYTAAFYAYADPLALLACERLQMDLDDISMPVMTDPEKADRVLKKLREYDRYAEGEIDAVLRSCFPDRAERAFLYLRLLIRRRGPVREMHADPAVSDALFVVRRVRKETHNMTGFLRFMETAGGVLYAPYTPDNDITEYLFPHFKARFGALPFVIHDLRREKACLYNGKTAVMTRLSKGEIVLSDGEDAFQNLWREYYDSVNIPERSRPKQMRGYMPVRYWKFLPEKRP